MVLDNNYLPNVKYSAGVVAFRDNCDECEILLVNHTSKAKINAGKHGLPAGKIEYFETPVIAGAREGGEESGYRFYIDSLEKILVLNGLIMIDNIMTPTVYHVFLATRYSGNLKASDNGKTIPSWHNIKNLNKISLISPDIEYIVDVSHKFFTKQYKFDDEHRMYLKER